MNLNEKHVVALVGRPNVGKSTLFNRLVGRRAAIVDDFAGVTRDRHYGEGTFQGSSFIVIDTGGFEPESTDSMLTLMRAQAELAIEEADSVIVVFDGRSGLLPADEEITRMMERSGKNVHYAVNKIDGAKHDALSAEFWSLGVSMIWPMSAQHGGGVYELLEALSDSIPKGEELVRDPHQVAVAVIGKPNVGKSTLINQLLGEERMLASEIPGTTRDSIDTHLFLPPDPRGIELAELDLADAKAALDDLESGREYTNRELLREKADEQHDVWFGAADEDLRPAPKLAGGEAAEDTTFEVPDFVKYEDEDPEEADAKEEARQIVSVLEDSLEHSKNEKRHYMLIDTAGIRRRKSIKTRLEKFSIVKSFKSIDRANVCLLLIDAKEGVTDQDARLAGLIQAKGRACIILVNKWDSVVDKDSRTAGQMAVQIREDLKFVRYAPIVFISALTGQRVHRIMRMVDTVMLNYKRRIPTGALNRFIRAVVARHQPPVHRGKRLQLFYATQVASAPPIVLFSVNYRESLHFSYERFMHNQLRARFNFEGVPIRFVFRDRKKRTRERTRTRT